MTRQPVVCLLCGRNGDHTTPNCPMRRFPSSLAQQIADARHEYNGWTPERKAHVVLQGTSAWGKP